MTLFHVTTRRKLQRYVETGGILPPVRGWLFEGSARAWKKKTGRDLILRIQVPSSYPLPDHQPPGHAHWHDGVVRTWEVLP